MEFDTAGNPILKPGEEYVGPEIETTAFDMTDYEREWRERIEAKLDRLLELLDKPAKPKVERPAVWFQSFWHHYPKKVGKKNAREIWKRRHLDKLKDEIIADVKNRVVNCAKWQAGYAPNPATYLNGDRWQDEIQQASSVPVTVPTEMNALVSFAKKRGIKHPKGKVGEPPHEFRARVMREVGGSEG